MDSRLVFRPRSAVLKPAGRRVAASACPLDMACAWEVALVLSQGEGPGRSGDFGQGNGGGPGRPRKAAGGAAERPYRKPTLVGRCESTKVGERTFVKELGNLTP